MRKVVSISLCLLLLAAAWLWWPARERSAVPVKSSASPASAVAVASAPAAAPAAPKPVSSLNFTNPLAYRLTNTALTLRQLAAKPHAILLQNALIDTDARLALNLPAHLQAGGDPGAYLVQARGPVNAAFRALLVTAGAQVVSYIPNNAYLVHAPAAVAGLLSSSPLVQVVLPYEPYYKLQPSLLGLAVTQSPLPPGTALNLGLFAADATAETQVQKAGATIIGRDRSAFGPVLRVTAPANWTALAQLPGVQAVEPAFSRRLANDLSRVSLGISQDTIGGSTNDWLGLTGANVLVAVNDTSVDATHPDLTGRVFGAPADLSDLNGHGTHVAGIIASSGVNSKSPPGPTDVGQFAEGSTNNADFRGKAPAASLFAINFNLPDYVLQTNAAVLGALISNNSWDNGDPAYDLAASSYDAATRDAIPFSPGSQPVLFVFAAGNRGNGNNEGASGDYDSILSPGTAKNVITVGAIEQLRNITNLVTTVINGVSNTTPYWKAWTDSSSDVAWYSSRGNVGVGTEGTFGRFKPDVVAPGTFVVSTRSTQWDTNAYYSNTNTLTTTYQYQVVATNTLNPYPVAVPPNTVGVTINVTANQYSPNPFPNMPIYANLTATPTTADFVATNTFTIPNGGNGVTLAAIVSQGGFNFAVGNPTNTSVNYDVTVAISVTNDIGNRLQVLEAMNEQLAPYYRYETGTSMSAAAVSGLLALMQDYFTNTLHQIPSPALLKAMLINGARQVGGNMPSITNQMNFDGWGLPNLTNSLPMTNVSATIGTNSQLFFVDQNLATALATGDTQTYTVTLNTNTDAQYLNLQVTLVWTDPPGDPNAAIKLVNNLDLIVTNLDTGDVYYGNDFSSDTGYSQPWDTNGPPNLDIINNVKQVMLPNFLAGHYSVTVMGRQVNVNALTAQTNNVLQDYALVISCVGNEVVPGAISSVSGPATASNPTSYQNITYITSTNSPLFNQFAGENSPLLGTNTLSLGTNTTWGSAGVLTVGMTNQWHFYIVTNNALDAQGSASDVTNAAFIVFNSDTLAIPRMGTLAGSTTAATRPEADIDVYVSTDPGITNLSPVAISNCLAGTVTATANSYGASLGQGGTEFVTFQNSQAGQVYYVGVKSEDHMAAEYAFLPIFTSVPFSQLDKNGNQIVNGMLLPVSIPAGNNAHPGLTNVFGLAIYPMKIAKVIVTNLNEHQNFGDLFGVLSFEGAYTVLNSHDGFGNTIGAAPKVYDDSRNPIAGSTNSDGPGSLVNFRGKSTPGLWLLSEEADSAGGLTGQVSVLTMKIQPHRDLKKPGVEVVVPAGGWFIDYVDVPPGYTNLTFYATNLPPTAVPPIQMYEKLGNEPTLTDYDQRADLTNGLPPGNLISVGPPLNQGQYFIGLYNPGGSDVTVLLSATLGYGSGVNDNYSFISGSPTVLLPDAVSGSDIIVPNTVTQLVSSVSVGMVVQTPRISDYTFTLVSPSGQRILLMENRGGSDTNGVGTEFVYTNVLNSTATGGAAPQTNTLAVPSTGITVPIQYNFYTVPDEMTVYGGNNPATFYVGSPDFLFDSGFTNNPPAGGGGGAQNTSPEWFYVTIPPGYTNITIIMNQFGNPYSTRGDAWTYTAGAPVTNYEYLVFTDDTNLANNVPIKFAAPPFSFTELSSNYTLCDFELATNGLYHGPTNIYDAFGGWTVPTNLVSVSTVFDLTNLVFVQVTNVTVLTNNQVSVVADPSDSIGDNAGTNLLALANGTITRNLATVPGRAYNVTFWFRGPGISSWWRGEGDATDSSDPEKNANNGALVGRFNFPAGEVGQSFGFEDGGDEFEFAGTNSYVQIPQSTSLDVGKGGGFTVEGWINPTNLYRPQPLVEWLAKVPTNTADTNFNIVAGPYLDPATGHYYYLLGATNRTVSENWAQALGGHLVTVNSANEENWIFDNFANYGSVNHNLWIGFTNQTATTFGWSSGQTNNYVNWMSGQPLNNSVAGPATRNYTFIRGATNVPSGLWVCADNVGRVQGSPYANIVYGVAEVDQIQTNGVQFWVSVTNSMPGGTNTLVNTNGCLYANLIDTSNVWHEVYSAPGLLQSNVFQHVALTFDTNSGLAKLFFNGTNVATTNLFQPGGPSSPIVPFVPRTDGDVLLGRDLTLYTNNYFGGRMDEVSIYNRALSDAEIAAIYRVSATATNGLTGKFDPAVVPETGLAEAAVIFGSDSNVIYGINNQWEVNSYTFTAASNTMPLSIIGLQPGILLDNFAVSEAPLTNLYYLPEQSLNTTLAGNAASGTWSLQVWDNLAGGYVTNFTQLVSWQLNLTLQSNSVVAAALSPQTPTPTTVGPGQLVDYAVTVPSWAKYATNILVSSTVPVYLYFNQTSPPTATVPPDYLLLANVTAGVGLPVLSSTNPPSVPPLLPGQTYYLGVLNTNATAASVVLEVDYDITALTNGVPYSSTLTTNDALRYFSFVVTSNAYAATFQLLKLSSNADLVVSRGVPLPNLTNTDYGSFNATNADENIFVLTNSAPVPLSAGTWYLGVIRRDRGPVNYSVLAKELDSTAVPTIIDLTNAAPFNLTAGPGAALTNFFRFSVTNNPALTNAHSVRFQLYNLSGNGDLTLQTNALPLAPPFFESSQNPGRSPELIWVYTNGALTNFPANWYLGVPNRELTNISYTIVAVMDTNAYFPAFPGAAGAGGGAVGAGHAGVNSSVYHVFTLADSGYGSLRDAVGSTNRVVVFDVSGSINLLTPLVITNSYLTIAGQTAPGGITVAGQMTALQSAHDVIIRDLRFRRGSVDDSLMLTNVSAVIADHVSAAWSDTVLSTLNSSNVTVQWSIIADSLYQTNNPAPVGSRLRYGNGALSFHHNLYADHYSGSPLLGDNLTLDFVNNVIYNWGLFSGLADGTNDLAANPNGCTNQLNYVCNYLIAGPDTATFGTNYAITNIAYFGGVTNSQFANWVFQTNNLIDSNTNQVLNGGNTQWAMFTNQYTQFGQPFPVIAVPTDEAFMAYEKVLDFAGVNMSLRDAADTNIVAGVRKQSGTIISSSPLSGAVAWWQGDGNANDSIGTNNGALVNGATYAGGKVGSSFYFTNVANPTLTQSVNGPGPEVVVPYNSLWAFGTNSFTIELWANFRVIPRSFGRSYGYPYDGMFICDDRGPGGLNKWWFALDDGKLDFHINGPSVNGGSGVFLVQKAFTPATNTWYHFAITRNGNLYTIYTNGVAIGSQVDATVIPNPNAPLTIGGGEGFYFNGRLDEVAVYKRALSQSEIKSIVTAGSAGKFASPTAVQPYLDSDQDGIPDFWEKTFGQDPLVPSNNQFSTNAATIGYTTLEEYVNWLAVPHAVAVTNTPVSVDLYQLSGNSGNLAFSVTNGVNGTVYLTNVLGSVTNTGPLSNSIAVFTPGPNYSGYASFDYYVTNTDTVGYFGPVTVSVLVSAVPVVQKGIITLTNLMPYTNQTVTSDVDYYRYDVSTNCYGVKYEIINSSGPVVLYARYGLPLPPAGNPYDTNPTNHLLVVTNTTPVAFNSGWWYLSVSNASGAPVSYTILVTELATPIFVAQPANTNINELTQLTVTNNATPPNVGDALSYSVSLAIDTNAMNALGWTNSYANTTNTTPNIDTNGVITWTPSEAQGPGVYVLTTIVTDTNAPPTSQTNSFSVTVNEVNTPPFWPTNVPSQTNYFTPELVTLVVSNTALDSDLPPNPLTYQLFVTPTPTNGLPAITNAVIDTNGIISWTPTLAQPPGVYTFMTIVTDTNAWALTNQVLSATNYFTVTVTPVSLPLAFTQPAQSANGQTAQLAGMATPGGLPATAWFQWGTSTNYGLVTPPLAVGATNFNVAYVTSLVTGLTVNVPYHFRLVVSNLVGAAYGFDQIFDQGNLVAWGADFLGQTVPIPPALTNLVTAIGAGYDFSLALNNNGTVVAWGDGIFGQTNVPPNLTNAVSVSGGYKDGLALRSDHTVLVWGSSQFKQTGTNVPANLTNAVLAVSGDWHCLALRADGTVVPWGNNSVGQTTLPAGLSNIVSIASGGYHSLALKNDGTVVSWGDNTYGQSSVPAGLSNVVAVAGGESHSLVLKNDGTLIAWGDNSLQQTNVPAGSNFIAIACGGFHSLALRNDGTVAQWGDSSAGQNPVFANTTLTNVFAIAGSGGGGFHSLALSSLYGLNQTNNAPFWTNSPVIQVFEITNQPANVLFTNAATDTNVPAQILTYQLLNAPAWASVGQYTGVLHFTPVETNGLGTNLITEVVTDNGYPPLSATNTITVLVNEINTPPFWPAGVPSQTNYLVNAGNLLTVGDAALDADLPANPLRYSVSVSGGVTNVFINPTNGTFAWIPGPPQVSLIPYTVTVFVTDSNSWALTNQSLTVSNTFTVTVLPPLTLTNGLPSPTNVIPGNSVEFYLVPVPTNADLATNRLLFAAPAGLNVWFTTNAPPSVGAVNDSLLITNSLGGSAVIGTNGVPPLVPGARYWLGVQNTNAFAVTNALEVDFHLTSSGTIAPVNFTSIISTNIAGTPGFWLTWFAPSNDLFQVEWSPSLPPVWTTFPLPPTISFNTNFPASATNAQFNFFDDGSQTGGFGTNRFYRLILLSVANTLTFPAPTNQVVSPGSTVTVTNAATDSNPGAVLTYSLLASPAGAVINSASGVITWTNATPSGIAARFTTLVVDNGSPSAQATNSFTVFVLPVPALASVTVTPTNTVLSWSAPTNDQFEVQWTTNLPPVWMLYPNNVSPNIFTSSTGVFTFTDTNAPLLTKFYQLILLP